MDIETLERYAEQAKEAWGTTDAYRESQERAKGRSIVEEQALGNQMMDIFAEIGQVMPLGADSEAARALAAKLQAFITEHFYTCTDEIFAGLGQAYAAGGEMTDNIDRAGGVGTAKFASEAIRAYLAAK